MFFKSHSSCQQFSLAFFFFYFPIIIGLIGFHCVDWSNWGVTNNLIEIIIKSCIVADAVSLVLLVSLATGSPCDITKGLPVYRTTYSISRSCPTWVFFSANGASALILCGKLHAAKHQRFWVCSCFSSLSLFPSFTRPWKKRNLPPQQGPNASWLPRLHDAYWHLPLLALPFPTLTEVPLATTTTTHQTIHK